MQIPTLIDSNNSASAASNVIGKIIAQNQAAKTQSVSSLAWASVLISLRSDDGKLTVNDLIDKYNAHPKVIATNDATGGTGSISLNTRLKIGVSNWVDKTSPEAFTIVVDSSHDEPFDLGPYGEPFALLPFVWVGSTVSLRADSQSVLEPLADELFIVVDWLLPLTEQGQTMLFKRVGCEFGRATACIPTKHKNKYRMQDTEILKIRNLIAFFCQWRAYLEQRLSKGEVDSYASDLENNSSRDDDLASLINARPIKASLSMLASQVSAAKRAMTEKEQRMCAQVDKERLQVRHWS